MCADSEFTILKVHSLLQHEEFWDFSQVFLICELSPKIVYFSSLTVYLNLSKGEKIN